MGLTAVIAAFAIEILSEEKAAQAALSGGAKLLQLPEFRDPDKAHKVMDYLSDAEHLYNLPGMDFGDDLKVLIGPENIAEDLEADLDKVKRICLTAKRFAPEYDAEQVFSELLKSKRRQG